MNRGNSPFSCNAPETVFGFFTDIPKPPIEHVSTTPAVFL
jgi:hypothetical protein